MDLAYQVSPPSLPLLQVEARQIDLTNLLPTIDTNTLISFLLVKAAFLLGEPSPHGHSGQGCC